MLDDLIAWQNEPESDGDSELSFRLLTLSEERGDLVLTLAGSAGPEGRSARWRLRAQGVCATELHLPEYAEGVEVASEHPLLLAHTARTTELSVQRAPDDPGRLLGDLWRAHRRLAGGWIAPEMYLNVSYAFLAHGPAAGGAGHLAHGPRPLLEAYAAVAQERGMRPSLVGDEPPRIWKDGAGWSERTEPLHVLLVGRSWVVAERFDAERIDPAS